VTEDKKWIATADEGSDSVLIVWDSHKGLPVKTIYKIHPNGVEALAFSEDSAYIVTISKASLGT
jgi:WD40 repeat protein